MTSKKATNIGIVAMDIYFPKTYVSQEALEKHDNAPAGKYTVGLGQTNMAFIGDREDINSICLTAVKSLLEKYNINPKDVGRLEVGTETIIDKSKSVKTTLMDLFSESGNMNLEGVDNVNACYGGTNALFNSIQWVESTYWDGRLALVVAGDIAIYAEGNARPTGGCGVIAMLIGPNAPIVFDAGLRGSHMENAYDFYKPNLSSEYPIVDGKLSNDCYLRAVDNCWARYAERFQAKEGRKLTTKEIDFIAFHAPYNKLVQKSYGRLLYNDFLQDPSNPEFKTLSEFHSLGLTEKSYGNPNLEKALAAVSKAGYTTKVAPSATVPKNIGNSYCGSLYAGLVSLVSEVGDGLVGKRVFLFSYGSGLCSSLFSFKVHSSVKHIAQKMDVPNRLAKRTRVSPEDFVKTLQTREKAHIKNGYEPIQSTDHLEVGTYYLVRVDDKLRRSYARKLKSSL